MKILEQSLRNIGLSEVESKIYLTLLEFGTLGISELAKMAKIHRTEAYRVLPHLYEIRLVSRALKGKRLMYSAESPKRIEELFLEFSRNFQKSIPELHALYEKTEDTPKFSYFEWKKAIQEANSDVITHLPKNGCYFRLSSGRHTEGHYMFYKENYQLERDRKWLERMIITNEKNFTSDTKNSNRSIVAIPKWFDLFEDHISKVIYGNRVTMIDYVSKTGFTIENERYAKYEEKVFRLLFQLLQRDEK